MLLCPFYLGPPSEKLDPPQLLFIIHEGSTKPVTSELCVVPCVIDITAFIAEDMKDRKMQLI